MGTVFTVYKTTNLVDGKYYLGVHKTSSPNDDYLGSGKLLKRAIAKHGIENFKKEVLFSFETAKEAFAKEKELVTTQASDALSYNIIPGGHGGFEYINSSGLNGTNVAHKQEIELRRRGTYKKRWDTEPAFREKFKLSACNALAHVSPEVRRRIAETNRGRKLPDDWKRHISESKQGKSNGHTGYIWMFRGEEKTKSHPDKVNQFINNGWAVGYKFRPPKPPKKLTNKELAPIGTKWCFGCGDFLASDKFHKGQRLCISCRKLRRKKLKPSVVC